MLHKIPTRPDPSADESVAYILDMVLVLARLAADAGDLEWSAQLRGVFKKHVQASHREWLVNRSGTEPPPSFTPSPPKGIEFDPAADTHSQLPRILALTAEARILHPEKAAEITEAERALIKAWIGPRPEASRS